MSGDELFRRAGELHPALRTRFIFSSGDIASPDTEAFLRESGRPALAKPYELGELRRMVERVVAGERAEGG